ncbi:winged helix-turn-helix transcriptional regulator [Methanocella sp. MCL-LM]|uniref:winged helix-turn-helix transcriptional regulator n=1 Tax=Methanocella sp. MCL-LM TaxID=3412035 RepID=UPI003C74ABF8
MYRGGLSLLTVAALTIFDRSGNRDRVMKLIEDEPGLTLYDIKRSLDLNIGTARYHLLMLSLNHRISSFNDGTKYVRYFKNSNTFTDEEKMIVSMLRRPHVKEILKAIIAQPGIQNIEVAASLGVQESVVSRCMRMLAVRGVVVKTSAKGEKAAYKTAEQYLVLILSSIQGTPK